MHSSCSIGRLSPFLYALRPRHLSAAAAPYTVMTMMLLTMLLLVI